MEKKIEELKQLIYKVAVDMFQNNWYIWPQWNYNIETYIKNNFKDL